MEGTRIPKKVFKAKFGGVRSVGKPRKRRENAVPQDAASFLRCRNCKLTANNITLWRQKIEEANARFGL
jgi:ribosomal protein L44E